MDRDSHRIEQSPQVQEIFRKMRYEAERPWLTSWPNVRMPPQEHAPEHIDERSSLSKPAPANAIGWDEIVNPPPSSRRDVYGGEENEIDMDDLQFEDSSCEGQFRKSEAQSPRCDFDSLIKNAQIEEPDVDASSTHRDGASAETTVLSPGKEPRFPSKPAPASRRGATKRLSMTQIRKTLHGAIVLGLPYGEIAEQIAGSIGSVSKYVRLAQVLDLTAESLASLSDAELELKICGTQPAMRTTRQST